MAKLTPAQQREYDEMRSTPGLLVGPDGRVIFDGEAEASGGKAFKTKAEFDAHMANLEKLLEARRREKELEDAAKERLGFRKSAP